MKISSKNEEGTEIVNMVAQNRSELIKIIKKQDDLDPTIGSVTPKISGSSTRKNGAGRLWRSRYASYAFGVTKLIRTAGPDSP